MSDEAKPFAWAVIGDAYEYATLLAEHAGAVAEEEGGMVVPLYRQPQPTLTQRENNVLRDLSRYIDREKLKDATAFWPSKRYFLLWQHRRDTINGILKRTQK